MPTVIRKSTETLLDSRREIQKVVSWEVRPNVWNPPTDEYETEDAYIIRVEIAGVREDDFEVTIENDTLLISGKRQDVTGPPRAFHQMEIRFGKFTTAVHLPGPVNADDAQAEYENGLLTVHLPKSK